jgi:glucose dehydrogenase
MNELPSLPPRAPGATLRSGVRRALALAATVLLLLPAGALTQDRGTPEGEWRYWGADAWSTRYSSLDQIDASNFEDLEVAWVWRGDNYGTEVLHLTRSTPIYVDGMLYTVHGDTRTVVAMDPATGETLWTYREPHTERWERSPRKNYGKGVAYDEVDGRGVIYHVSPAFFLHALDAKTGRHLEGFGGPLPLEGFPETGVVDMLEALGYPYDPNYGIHDSISTDGITNSSPAIVVNGVVVVGASHEQGYFQFHQRDARGDILAFDGRTGEHRWTFEVIPQSPDAYGFDTWENDAWQWVGSVSAWAPMSADPELGIVYVPTDPPTVDYFGGHHPGDNLFSTSVLALDAQTGERVWHFQFVHHDIWNYDTPHAPSLVNITVDGREIPALVQTTKQSFAYTFDRATGEPVWPIEEREVPQSDVPGEQTSPTQPFPTRPAAYEMQGLTEDDLIDFTPEVRQMALDIVSQYRIGPLFNPPAVPDPEAGIRAAIHCPGANGGTNIPGGTVVDPESGILYTASTKGCSAPVLMPGTDADPTSDVDWVSIGPGGVPGPAGLPLWKPPFGRITAIDMNTGEHLWWIPNGDTPDFVKDHELLEGVDLPNTGQRAHATKLVTRTLLMSAEGRGARPLLHAIDKRTGETLGTVELPAASNTAPMTYVHEGKQYVVIPIGDGNHPAGLVALALP